VADEEPSPVEGPEEPEPKPPREKIKIVDVSEASGAAKEGVCKVCGKLKPVFVEIEVGGRVEYTCEECFKMDVADIGKKCGDCGAPLKVDDAFCGKCGKPTEKKCLDCGAVSRDDDTFCGRCGTKL